MPSVADRLEQVTRKLDRARQHLGELEAAIAQFLKTQPYRIGTRRDATTRRLIYFLTDVRPTPPSLPVIAGDVIQNLVTALDHLAYQLVCSDTADNPPRPRGIYFPIFDSQQGYEDGKARKLQGNRPGNSPV